MKKGSRYMRCACGCGVAVRVGMGVAWILRGVCANRLGSILAKLNQKKRRKTA